MRNKIMKYKTSIKHLHQTMKNRKMVQFYTSKPQNHSHQSSKKCVNL